MVYSVRRLCFEKKAILIVGLAAAVTRALYRNVLNDVRAGLAGAGRASEWTRVARAMRAL